MIKTSHFIKGYSGEYAPAFFHKLHPCSFLKKRGKKEHCLLKRSHWAGLEQFYAALLI
jgi:hypothetical protein